MVPASLRHALRATGLALLANAALYLLARALGVAFQVTPPGQAPREVDLVSVVLFTAVPMLLGFALYLPVRRRTPRAFPLFASLALLVFVLFLFPPFAATPRPDTRAVLLLLHVPPVAAYLWGLWRMEGEIRP
ncbi:uncharacterized protein TTMY_0557 [Thermus thermophilus]|uniref:DUF6069 family protein n=1 Tax=Thermus thermophilus TaxID=274 RepID=UPI00090C30BE|nr:DUF6069 family protein [Thermus thermophilus]BAW00967.1 uncharacterized protein TTMY_0557 [Thermus thermophilus]BDB11651.1 hypothetical protein TthTMY_13900 [Thermus thermophilus]